MSKKSSKNDQKLLKDFVSFMHEMDNPAQVQRFLEAILTPQELRELPRRLEIVKLLHQGMPQREIAQSLGLGIATVTRGSRVKDEAIFKQLKS